MGVTGQLATLRTGSKDVNDGPNWKQRKILTLKMPCSAWLENNKRQKKRERKINELPRSINFFFESELREGAEK